MRRRCREAGERLREKVVQASRAAAGRRDPSLRRYRELLRPRGLPQERVLSMLLLVLAGAPEGVEEAVRDHLDAVEAGRPAHWLLPMGAAEGERA
jgi:hypothetical protein